MKPPKNYYGTLDGHKVIPVDKLSDSIFALEPLPSAPGKRHVGYTQLTNGVLISTVFLGINHGFFGEDLWFETMIFGLDFEDGEYQVRYGTWDEAEAGHAEAVRIAQNKIAEKK